MLIEGELHHVRLAREVRVEERNRLGPGVDQRGARRGAMAAGCSDHATGREDARARDLSGALLGSQTEDVVRIIARIEDGREAAVEKAVQRANAGLRSLASPIE